MKVRKENGKMEGHTMGDFPAPDDYAVRRPRFWVRLCVRN